MPDGRRNRRHSPNRAKVLLGIGRGRKLYDKREKLKKDTVKRDMARAMRER